MSINPEQLRRSLMEAARQGISPEEVFRGLGISPDDPQVLEDLMKQAGLDPGSLFPDGQADIRGMIDNLTRDLRPEVKQQLSRVIQDMAHEMSGGQPLPPDVESFLKGWGKDNR